MKTLLLVAMLSVELCAQSLTQPSSAGPVVGVVNGPDSFHVTPILGIAAAASLGTPITIPEGATKVYLPPRQQYALLEQQGGASLELWNLRESRDGAMVQPVARTFGHADWVAFSPKGFSAAIYSKTRGSIQILTGLPGLLARKADVSTQPTGTISNLALSDDGAVLVAKSATGDVNIWSQAKGWRLMPWNYSPLAWSFIANSHDLVVSAFEQPGLLLFRQVDGANSAPETFPGVAGYPDSLAVTSDGENIIAADSTRRTVWSIELKTGAVWTLTGVGSESSLLTLRDGHTFLVSVGVDSSFSLLKLANSTADPVLLIHPGSQTTKAQGVRQ